MPATLPHNYARNFVGKSIGFLTIVTSIGKAGIDNSASDEEVIQYFGLDLKYRNIAIE